MSFSREENKENRIDNSRMTSKEIFDLSQNSVSDLLNTQLGVTKIMPQNRSPSRQIQQSPEHQDGRSSFCLHFFQSRSNRLHIVSYSDGQVSKEEMQLGEFVVPRFHKSLLTSEGVIILTGGFVEDVPSKKTYLVDIERNIMAETAEMNIGRTGHVMIAHAGLIYVLGGVTEDGVCTDSCEVFSPQLNSWSEIASLNQPCHSACAVSANGSIFKIGGKLDEGIISQSIERFNGREWIDLQFDTRRLTLFSSSVVFQVSPNELMIVGGTEEEYKDKTGDTYFLRIADCEKTGFVQSRKGPNLPVKEAFWTQEVECIRNKFYLLQNVVHHSDLNSVLLDQRRLLEFNPVHETWKVLASQ